MAIRGVSEVSSQILRQIERGTYFLCTTRPRPPVPPQKTTRPRRLCCARPKSTEKAQKEPRAGGAENANDGKAPARPTKTEPTSTRAAHPARNRPETAPDERGTSSSLKALINAVAEIPTVSSLHRWRPAQQHEHDPRAGLRAAQARCPHRPRSARVATQWWLSHLEQRGWPTISSTTLDGKPPLADDEAWLGMTHLVLKSW